MGLSCFRAISGIGLGWMGWDLCAGLFYEHRLTMLIICSSYFLTWQMCTYLNINKFPEMSIQALFFNIIVRNLISVFLLAHDEDVAERKPGNVLKPQVREKTGLEKMFLSSETVSSCEPRGIMYLFSFLF